MKTRLVPVYFDPGKDDGFDAQLAVLGQLLVDEAELLPAQPLGAELPEADAVVLPQLLGEAYRRVGDFLNIELPILVITSEFGTLSMWDWEIATYLKTEGVRTILPYNLVQTKKLLAAARVRRELQTAKFLVYQDNPGDGFQASIFKRFYWWEDECSQRIRDWFGVEVVRRSFRELSERAKAVSDTVAEEVWQTWQSTIAAEALGKPLLAAIKLYVAVKEDVEQDPAIKAAGINCLNESHFSDTTPCLAWNMLYERDGLIWGCEADTVSMLTKYLLHKSLGAPVMMTNLYPFLLGDAATKHERIPSFPEVAERPEDHLLVAHCGYMGVIPESFSTEWTLREKVLAIVDENATAIDARLPTGDVTLAKLLPTLQAMSVIPGELTHYVQFPGSDCRNGGVIRVRDGHQTIKNLCSHHYLLVTGERRADIELVADVFGLAIEQPWTDQRRRPPE